jgi:micrococcal nuclease
MNILLLKLRRDILVFVWLFIALSFSCEQKKQPEPNQAATREVVDSVFDGDTFKMSGGRRVRIVGIDTPEAGEQLHDEARDYLASLILNKEIEIKPITAGADRYQRVLAEVFIDTVDIGLAMIRSGYAQLYLFNDDSYLKEKYLPVLKNSIDHKMGLWGLVPPKTEAYYLTTKGSYRFHRPLCRSLKNANPKNLRRIKTRIEAIESGLSPCRNCHP